jgi:hypothetical protein
LLLTYKDAPHTASDVEELEKNAGTGAQVGRNERGTQNVVARPYDVVLYAESAALSDCEGVSALQSSEADWCIIMQQAGVAPPIQNNRQLVGKLSEQTVPLTGPR